MVNRIASRLNEVRARSSSALARLRAWWKTQPKLAKQLFVLWLLTIGVFLQSDHHNQSCFREYFGTQTYRATKTDDILETLRDAVSNQQAWTDELSHPPETLWGNYGPDRQAWLTDIGRRATQRSQGLVDKVNRILGDKADHPYPVARCGAPG